MHGLWVSALLALVVVLPGASEAQCPKKVKVQSHRFLMVDRNTGVSRDVSAERAPVRVGLGTGYAVWHFSTPDVSTSCRVKAVRLNFRTGSAPQPALFFTYLGPVAGEYPSLNFYWPMRARRTESRDLADFAVEAIDHAHVTTRSVDISLRLVTYFGSYEGSYAEIYTPARPNAAPELVLWFEQR